MAYRLARSDPNPNPDPNQARASSTARPVGPPSPPPSGRVLSATHATAPSPARRCTVHCALRRLRCPLRAVGLQPPSHTVAGALRQLRRALGSRLHGRPPAERPPLLYRWRLPAQGGGPALIQSLTLTLTLTPIPTPTPNPNPNPDTNPNPNPNQVAALRAYVELYRGDPFVLPDLLGLLLLAVGCALDHAVSNPNPDPPSLTHPL
eukprot:scaffold24967_cov66-Phaeocystis_antarctica.AAC.2